MGGEEGEGEMYGEKNTEIYKTTCETDHNGIWYMTQGTQTGALRQAEWWGGEGDGRAVWEGGDMHVLMAAAS